MSKEERYYHTEASANEYIELAKGVDGRRGIAAFEQYLPAGTQVLELGSGPGKDWELLSRNYEVTGSDYSSVFVDRLKGMHPNTTFLTLNAVTLSTHMVFDGIYSNKVLHHLTDEELASSIQRQMAILHEGGMICHTFWKGEGDEVFKGMYVNYHNEEEVQRVFGPFFEILRLESYAEFEEGDSLLLIAKKKVWS